MSPAPAPDVSPDTLVHRIGGARIENLRLKPKERSLQPPGISVFLGGKPMEAAEQVCAAFPNANRLLAAARTVASATAKDIRQVGFDVIVVPTRHFANHGRLTHPDGVAGFDDKNLKVLAQAFLETVVG